MYKKIAVVCTNPWERFLPFVLQSNAKKYYEWLHKQAVLRKENSYFREKITLYGDLIEAKQEPFFSEAIQGFQIIYIQTRHEEMLGKVFQEADFILVGMPQDKNECDRIFLLLLPWIEKCLFIWDGRSSQGDEFFRKIQREYKIKETQIMEMNKLPSV